MASEILGLFSGQSPQQLRNAYLDSMMVSPAQMGSQGLLQQVVSMGRNAGAVLGTGAGQLLGGKVAGEVEAGYMDQAIKEASADKTLSPTQRMEKVAEFLADKPGMGALYLKAVQEARKMKEQDLTFKRGEVGLESDQFALERAKVLAPLEEQRAKLGVQIDESALEQSKKINPLLVKQAELAVKRDEINIDVVRENLAKAKQELAESKDLAPARKKLLENQVAMGEFTLAAARAYEPVKLAEAQGRLDALTRETNVAKALGALPADATDDQIRAVIRQNGGDAKLILQDITRVQVAKENAAAKKESARLAAEARRAVSDAKLAQMPKDVAEKVTANIALESGVKRMDDLITKINKGEVNFTVLDSAWAKANAMLGNFTPEGKIAADTKAEIKAQANLVLQNAKGVQTEGDAQRAYDLIINDLEKNSTAGVKSALTRLKAQQELTIKGNKEYARIRGIRDEDINPVPTKPITAFDE